MPVAQMDAHLWLAAEIAVEEAHHPGRMIDQVQLPLRNLRHDVSREPPRPRPNLAYDRIWTKVLKRRGLEQRFGGIPAELFFLVVVDVHPEPLRRLDIARKPFGLLAQDAGAHLIAKWLQRFARARGH